MALEKNALAGLKPPSHKALEQTTFGWFGFLGGAQVVNGCLAKT